jgi:predicted dehydrogenase
MTKLALVGCGAIAEAFHLPAIARDAQLLKSLVLVDPVIERATRLAKTFGVRRVADSAEAVSEHVDGAIIAVPARFHHPVAAEWIARGCHVLVEKPLAASAELAQQLVDLADRHGVALAVNQTRRLFPPSRHVWEIARSRRYGGIRHVQYDMGEPFDWPAATASYFGVSGGGRGVLADTGAHIIDLLCWWLGDEPRVVSYRDDSHGGTEAVAHLELAHATGTARVRMSWLSKLDNGFRVEFERATVSGGAYDFSFVTEQPAAEAPRTVRVGGAKDHFGAFAARMIDNFVRVTRGEAKPLASGGEVLPSLRVIDECYGQRRGFEMPWMQPREVQA